MSDFTPRASLRLPGGGSTGTILPDEQVDIDVLNDNFRKIDALLGARNIPSASSYAGSMDGDLVYALDTGYLHMFSVNAGGLITPGLPGANVFTGTSAERTAFTSTATDGMLWQDTNGDKLLWRKDGASWVSLAASQGEVDAGTDKSKYVTPETLRGWSGLLDSGTFTAQSVIDIAGLTGHSRYEITLIIPTTSASSNLSASLLNGTTANTSAVHDRELTGSTSGTTFNISTQNLTGWQGIIGGNRDSMVAVLTVFNLNEAEQTFAEIRSQGWITGAQRAVLSGALRHRSAVAFDGIRFEASAGTTLTGRYEVRAL